MVRIKSHDSSTTICLCAVCTFGNVRVFQIFFSGTSDPGVSPAIYEAIDTSTADLKWAALYCPRCVILIRNWVLFIPVTRWSFFHSRNQQRDFQVRNHVRVPRCLGRYRSNCLAQVLCQLHSFLCQSENTAPCPVPVVTLGIPSWCWVVTPWVRYRHFIYSIASNNLSRSILVQCLGFLAVGLDAMGPNPSCSSLFFNIISWEVVPLVSRPGWVPPCGVAIISQRHWINLFVN